MKNTALALLMLCTTLYLKSNDNEFAIIKNPKTDEEFLISNNIAEQCDAFIPALLQARAAQKQCKIEIDISCAMFTALTAYNYLGDSTHVKQALAEHKINAEEQGYILEAADYVGMRPLWPIMLSLETNTQKN